MDRLAVTSTRHWRWETDRDGRITFVLARGIGGAFVARGVDEAPALETVRRSLAA